MNINQLRYALELSRSSSMREAAARLYISQPALSASIRELEDELGLLLFDRTNRGVSLTAAGREFLTYAKKAVGQYEVLEERFLAKDNDKEHFSVSTQHYNFAIRAFTNMIRRYGPEKYVFSIHETKTREVLEDVGNLRSEVGVLSFPEANEGLYRKLFRDYHLAFMPLMRRDTYIYVWKDHPLAVREKVSLKELDGFPCVVFDQSDDRGLYLAEEAISDYDFSRIIKTDDRATSMEIIASLGGYSIGSGMLSGEDAVLQGLVSVKLREEDPIQIGYITRKESENSVLAKAYIDELQKYREIQAI